MLYEANIYQMQVEDHLFWVAESKALKGCVGQGETSEEAIKELEINEKEWIETATEFDIPIPPRYTKTEKTYSGKISLRVSPVVHEEAALAADSLKISLNQFINDALISYTASINKRGHNTIKHECNEKTIKKIVYFPGTSETSYSLAENLEEM